MRKTHVLHYVGRAPQSMGLDSAGRPSLCLRRGAPHGQRGRSDVSSYRGAKATSAMRMPTTSLKIYAPRSAIEWMFTRERLQIDFRRQSPGFVDRIFKYLFHRFPSINFRLTLLIQIDIFYIINYN
jgi:hypothetical protein